MPQTTNKLRAIGVVDLAAAAVMIAVLVATSSAAMPNLPIIASFTQKDTRRPARLGRAGGPCAYIAPVEPWTTVALWPLPLWLTKLLLRSLVCVTVALLPLPDWITDE